MKKHITDKLNLIEQRCAELEQLMGQTEVISDMRRAKKLGKEYREKKHVLELYREYKQTLTERDAASEILTDEKDDEELIRMANDEIRELDQKLKQWEEDIYIELLPKERSNEDIAIVEIRAGAGGDEAGLFAGDLQRMYYRYAEHKKWKVTQISNLETGVGSVKETTFQVNGEEAYRRLRMESGVHRVQRVPVTESQGRLHTSTATVAVLPQVEDTEVEIKDTEIKVDIFHAGGHGGQNVNKVATAVRLTHIPTGLVVVCQNERAQLQNRRKAMEVLRARLWDSANRQSQAERASDRRSQIGGGDRSEKIRTYNYPQSRITDHRILFTTHRLREVLDGELDELVDALLSAERAQLLAQPETT